MAIVEIKVPKLPPDEDAFHLLEWKKMIGDVIAIDDLLIEVETSKVVLEVRSPSAGVLIEIVVVDGGVAVSNQVIARRRLGDVRYRRDWRRDQLHHPQRLPGPDRFHQHGRHP